MHLLPTPYLAAARINQNNTGSPNRADLPGADVHLYTEPELPFSHLYWRWEAFNHWAPVRSSGTDRTFPGLWFPFESLPFVTMKSTTKQFWNGKTSFDWKKQSAKYRVCVTTMSGESDVQWREQTAQLSLQPHQWPPDQSFFHWHQQYVCLLPRPRRYSEYH